MNLNRSIDSDCQCQWHVDRLDRIITVLSSDGWKLQMDNEYPIDLIEGAVHEIPANTPHRVLKGNGTLEVEINEKE